MKALVHDEPPATEEPGPGRFAAAGAGVLGAATVLGVGHLVAAMVDPDASPFLVLGSTMVDLTPRPLKDFAIRQFGANDKAVLFLAMAVVMVVGAAVAGLLERRRRFAGVALLAALGAVTLVAALQRPTATPSFALPALVGTVAGALALRALMDAAETDPTAPGRRKFLGVAAGVGVLALGAAAGGRWLTERLRDSVGDREVFALPAVDAPAPPPPVEATAPVGGVTRFVTPNNQFYRVDTALRLPALPSGEWRLRVHGMVEREVVYDFEALRGRRAVERMVTLTCVSNEVGGDLAGNAVWTGYPLADLLAEAGVRPDADMLLSRSIDGFTASTPVSAILDGRDALLAIGMNGEPLPIQHGYPARLVIPGLYGYVSATKWVVDLELTRFDRATAYWTDRGWADRAPIETASRIDVPGSFGKVPAGEVVVAGVAWAQRRGITAVEVQVDDRPWQPATLAAEYSTDTWRQWYWRWDATPGTHTLRVRATDGTGAVQTEERTPPFPDGATGWHSRVVTVQ